MKYFNELFDYDYSRNMEIKLDEIKEDSSSWFYICKETNKTIDILTKNIKQEQKEQNKSIFIDPSNILLNTKYGPTVKHTIDNNTFEYLPVKKGISLDNELSLDIVEFKTSKLGSYQEIPISIKIGKFGPYLEWNHKNYGIKDIGIELCNIGLEDAISFIEKGNPETDREGKMSEKSKTILRVIDKDTSIRKGKFGPYIFLKTPSMKKPKSINASNLNIDILTCDKLLIYSWIKSQTNIKN